ncbi:MAG: ABC transporter permease [Coriobacteriales bacterium]|jgi:sodium transport system permease protein|nr:ABC transporter permease [Coriobacteriales bacterium]
MGSLLDDPADKATNPISDSTNRVISPINDSADKVGPCYEPPVPFSGSPGGGKSGLLAIITKELRRFFTDRRMVITTLLMPGLLIYVVYSFIGAALANQFTVPTSYEPKLYVLNLPDSLRSLVHEAGLDLIEARSEQVAEIKQDIASKTDDLLAVFPADFDEVVSRELNGLNPQDPALSTAFELPQVELFFNSTRVESTAAYSSVYSLLDSYKEAVLPLFTVNAAGQSYDLASQQDKAGFVVTSFFPMLLMIFLYSGCIAVAPESIAGEKERGTIATLLVTPLKRWEMALGKVISLGMIALLSGLSSFLGVMLSLPRILAVGEGASGEGTGDALNGSGLDVGLYSASDYLMLLAVILSTVLLLIGLISVISAFARTVKEANTMVMPLMILVMLVGVMAMFSQSAQEQALYYLVPGYNSVQSMVAIFSFTAQPLHVTITVGANLLITALCVVMLTRMFSSEKIMFNR